MGCLLDDLRGFGIDPDKWTIAAQDEGEWYKTAKQGAELFMMKRIAVERARVALRHAVVPPNVTGGTKERVAQSELVLVCSLLLTSHSSANSYLLGGGISTTFQHISDVACCVCLGSVYFFWCSVAP